MDVVTTESSKLNSVRLTPIQEFKARNQLR